MKNKIYLLIAAIAITSCSLLVGKITVYNKSDKDVKVTYWSDGLHNWNNYKNPLFLKAGQVGTMGDNGMIKREYFVDITSGPYAGRGFARKPGAGDPGMTWGSPSIDLNSTVTEPDKISITNHHD